MIKCFFLNANLVTSCYENIDEDNVTTIVTSEGNESHQYHADQTVQEVLTRLVDVLGN